jgi:alpha/beta superfamily hydrolase
VQNSSQEFTEFLETTETCISRTVKLNIIAKAEHFFSERKEQKWAKIMFFGWWRKGQSRTVQKHETKTGTLK